MNPMPFDELNALKATLPQHFENGKIRSEQDYEDILDEMLDLFLLAYASGVAATNVDMNADYQPDIDTVMDTVDKEVAGETWRDRMAKIYENGGTEADVARIIETETHRDSNEAAFVTARANGATEKTWHCLMLPTSRDSHVFLNGVTVPIDGEFYSINGGTTQFPGEWGIADEDCGCLCFLTYSK